MVVKGESYMGNKQVLSIIYGGKSSEHEVSLRTAYSILEAVDYHTFTVLPIYIGLDGQWVKGNKQTSPIQDINELRLTKNGDLSVFELARETDVFLPVVHGPYGEDGTLQGMLEMLDVPYVGSGVLGSALGMDKLVMKKIFAMHDIPQGDYIGFTRQNINDDMQAVCAQIEKRISYPCFIKPANLGSSVGISKAKNQADLQKALLVAAKYDRKIIVEEFIDGREIEIGVLGNDDLKTSVVGEITTSGEFYDYAAKYKNTGETTLDIPAHNIPANVLERISALAKQSVHALECSGLARVDFFYQEETDRLFVNEINTMPGFTPFSMYPMLFKESGVSYSSLIKKLIHLAVERYAENKQNHITAESLD